MRRLGTALTDALPTRVGYDVVCEEALAGRASEPSRQRQAAQHRRGAVALLAVLEVERVEHAEHVVESDHVGPGEDPARVVEPVDHARIDVLAAADALAERERGFVDHLADDPSQHQARARRTPTPCACRATGRTARWRRSPTRRCRVRRSARRAASRPAAAARESRRPNRRGQAPPASRRAGRSPGGAPCRGASGSSPPVRSRIRNGASRSWASLRRGDRPAGGVGGLCELDRQLRLAGDHDQRRRRRRRAGGSGSSGRWRPSSRILVVAAAATCGRSGPRRRS